MNILFLTMLSLKSIEENNLYADLMRTLIKRGDTVKIACPTEGNPGEGTHLIDLGGGSSILRVKTDPVQKVNVIKKGFATLKIEPQFKNAVKTYLSDIKFDLIMYSTPPITFAGVVSYVKKRDNAKTYLLLKDIFPQNAVDIGMMTKNGPKSIIYKVFRNKEKKLYALSDYIGCMSQANVDYLISHNSDIPEDKVHINPNSIEVIKRGISESERNAIREKYNVPKDVTAFVYGGNLGRPQGIPFIIDCLRENKNRKDRFFVICGTGTEYPLLKKFADTEKPENLLLINGLPRDEYEQFVKAFDVGLIFLDSRFTIPNFPSRLLSYMQSSMPVIACTDKNTDIGKVIVEGGFGLWCESKKVSDFTETVNSALLCDLEEMGKKGFDYLVSNYTVEKSCDIVHKYAEKEPSLI